MQINKNHNRDIVPSPSERVRERSCSPTEKLNCIQHLLHQCDRWLAAEAGKQTIPAHRVLDTWLFETKEQWQQRYRAKQKVRERLQQLYQKQLALLASPLYNNHSSLLNNQ